MSRRGRFAAGDDHRLQARRSRSTPSTTRPSTSPARACGSSLGRRTGRPEAIEDRARPFMLAVQWHAETLIERPEHGALFAALVQAAGARPLRLAAAA